MSDTSQIDALISQNQMLIHENARLKTQCDRPKSREETYAACMRSATGTKCAMAVESIGEHCDKLLQK